MSVEAPARTVPHDLDAERAALGAVLVAPEAWALLVSGCSETDFFRDAHRRIFRAMAGLAADGVVPDLVTLAGRLGAELGEIGGRSYLAALIDGVPRSTNVAYYARIVREQAQLRAALAVGEQLVEACYERADPRDVVAASLNALAAVRARASGGLRPADTVVADYLGAISDGTAAALVPTGFADLDGLIGGLAASDLVIIAARPSTGKTSLALAIAETVAATAGPVPFFSLEMSEQRLAGRLIAWRSGVPAARVERGQASDADYQRIANAAAGVPARLLFETSAGTVAEIDAWCQRAQSQLGQLGAIVIDYLQLLSAERRRDSIQAEVAGISRGLKRLAKTYQAPVVALSQLSRASESRRDKRPLPSDLRDSGTLEQDCDVALLLFREEMYVKRDDNAGLAEVIVAKARNGPTGVVRLQFEAALAQFRNLAVTQEMPW